MNRMNKWSPGYWIVVFMGVAVLFPSVAFGAPIVFSDSGANALSIQDTVDLFRASLGNPNNANAPGPLAGGRREINWDGGGPPVINGTAPVTPFTVFQNTRGATFTTPGIGLTQAAATGGLLSLDLINPTYAATFATFSPNRLFTPIGSNITEGTFSLPGTGGAVPATVSGFGAVFTDVDLANITSIQYFDATNASLGTFFVPSGVAGAASSQTLSFLGVNFTSERIFRVRITTGNSALGPDDGIVDTPNVDVVVMDDFLYSEPQAVPEPTTLLLLGSGLAGFMVWRRFFS